MDNRAHQGRVRVFVISGAAPENGCRTRRDIRQASRPGECATEELSVILLPLFAEARENSVVCFRKTTGSQQACLPGWFAAAANLLRRRARRIRNNGDACQGAG